MSNSCCCSKQTSDKTSCPGCGESAETVSTTTLLHQLKQPWQKNFTSEPYYFCSRPNCEVVYFNSAGETFTTQDLRQQVGQKTEQPERLICYCFDIHASDLADSDMAKSCYEFVVEKTRDKLCRCEERNPSGRCCLRDFPKPLE